MPPTGETRRNTQKYIPLGYIRYIIYIYIGGYKLNPPFFCARVCLFAVVGGMLCKSDKPSINININTINTTTTTTIIIPRTYMGGNV